MFPLKLLDEVVDETALGVIATKASVTSGGLHLEDTLLDGSSTQIEDEHVMLADGLLAKTVGDADSRRLVGGTEDVETGDGAGFLGGLTLRVVEV